MDYVGFVIRHEIRVPIKLSRTMESIRGFFWVAHVFFVEGKEEEFDLG